MRGTLRETSILILLGLHDLNRVHFETVGFLLAGEIAVPYNGLHRTKRFKINDTS